jgi:phospholipid-translocating ATPase
LTNTEEKPDEKFIVYNSDNPDDLALVNGARHMGFTYERRDEDGYMIIDVPELGEERQKYKLLNIIEFNSDRKRMTVIVETPDK